MSIRLTNKKFLSYKGFEKKFMFKPDWKIHLTTFINIHEYVILYLASGGIEQMVKYKKYSIKGVIHRLS